MGNSLKMVLAVGGSVVAVMLVYKMIGAVPTGNVVVPPSSTNTGSGNPKVVNTGLDNSTAKDIAWINALGSLGSAAITAWGSGDGE